uniref:Uncharacterized protein n=1 Tax=Steinernema glaseri TaxID=37863 RepID=A0A1I8AGZ4_9BILA
MLGIGVFRHVHLVPPMKPNEPTLAAHFGQFNFPFVQPLFSSEATIQPGRLAVSSSPASDSTIAITWKKSCMSSRSLAG